MSKELATRFLLLLEKDGELGEAFQAIKARHELEGLSGENLRVAITEGTVQLARARGYDVGASDFSGLLAGFLGEPLTDEELGLAVGGRGEYQTRTHMNLMEDLLRTFSCDLAPDDATFQARYLARGFNNGCPTFEYRGIGANHAVCACCKHFQSASALVARGN